MIQEAVQGSVYGKREEAEEGEKTRIKFQGGLSMWWHHISPPLPHVLKRTLGHTLTLIYLPPAYTYIPSRVSLIVTDVSYFSPECFNSADILKVCMYE